MQNVVLSKQEVQAADRKVGFTIAWIGVVVSAFMAATVVGLTAYWQSFYTWLH